jgi:hypothetical protein
MELHFYPGQHFLIVKGGGKIIERFEAWGGPASIGRDPYMPEEPTWPGLYYIDRAYAYSTPSWKWSQIKWGTKLRDLPRQKDVWYKLPNGQWGSVSKDFNIKRDDIMKLNFRYYGFKRVPPTWIFNDFGPIAIRWFKDLNSNKVLDDNEKLSGQMFHTTPSNEAQHARGLPVKLTPSHGCIHLKPTARNRLFSMGAFKPKTPLIVHRYNEKF